MLGVPAASSATTALLFLAGVVLVAAIALVTRRRLTSLAGLERAVAAAVALSLVAVPWMGWRFVEDLRYTTNLDSYDRANAGPIQAYLPGYLVDRARQAIPPDGTWATRVGRLSNRVPAQAFSPLVLVTLFPRVSARAGAAQWILTLGARPSAVARVRKTTVLRPATAGLPAARLAETTR